MIPGEQLMIEHGSRPSDVFRAFGIRNVLRQRRRNSQVPVQRYFMCESLEKVARAHHHLVTYVHIEG
jgi:hypothetical protein